MQSPEVQDAFFDETGGGGDIRPPYRELLAWIGDQGAETLSLRHREAETLFRKIGITFAVYGEGGSPERLIPFDIVPRILLPRNGGC